MTSVRVWCGAAWVAAIVLLAPSTSIAQQVHIESTAQSRETSVVFFTAHFSGRIDLGPPGDGMRPRVARPGGGSFDALAQDRYEIQWNFGDGSPLVNTGERPTVAHVFGQQGTYTVTAEVTGPRGVISRATRQVTIENVEPRVWPIAALRLDDTARTLEFTAPVTDTPKDTLTYTWDFGDGTTVSDVDRWRVRHTWTTDGPYTVTLRVEDGDGGEHQAAVDVVVGERPRTTTIAPEGTTRADVPTTAFTGMTSGSVAAPLDARVKPIAGLFLQSTEPGVCRFAFSAWDPSQLAHVLFLADLRNLRGGETRFRITNPRFTIAFDPTRERYRASEQALQVNTMATALAGLRGLVGEDGTPVEAREGIGIDPATAPDTADDRQPPARSPLGLDDRVNFRFAGGVVDLVMRPHDRAEATFDVRLENTDTSPEAIGGIAFRGTVSIDLQAARGQGIVSYEGCAAQPFSITRTSPDVDARHERSSAWPMVTFDAPYDPATLDETTFQLGYRNPAGTFVPVPARVVRAERTALLMPDTPLLGGVRYEARVKTGPDGVLGRNGAELDDPTGDGHHAWHFHSRLVFRADDTSPLAHNLACHVLQTVRDAPLIRHKPAVARLYADWKRHAEVLDEDQLESFTGRVTLKAASGQTLASVTHVFVRPDLWEARGVSQAKAEHTANLFGWSPEGNEGAQLRVEMEAETSPGTWERLYYTRCPAAYWKPEPRLTIDYYLLAMGDWFPWPPAATMQTLHTVYSQGEQFALQVFPLQSIVGRYRGTMRLGPLAQAALLSGMASGNGVAEQVVTSYATLHATDADLVLAFGPMGSLTGGNTPVRIGPGGAGVAYSLFDDNPALRDRYIFAWVHEVGHALALDHIPYISTTAEQESMKTMRESSAFDYDGIEGFRLLRPGWTGWNKSASEGNGEGPRTVPLMFPATIPYRHTFIATHHYHQLQHDIESKGLLQRSEAGVPRPVLMASAGAGVPWLPPQDGPPRSVRVSVAGAIDGEGTSAWLGPLVTSDRAPDAGVDGAYTMALLDASGTRVGATRFDVPAPAHGGSVGVFRASVPWDDRARRLVVSRGDTVLAERTRSAHAPTVRVTSPTPGQRLADEITVTWTATDADGDPLTATVLYSSEGGANGWSTVALWLDTASLTVDTTTLEPGPNPTFRVVVSDGFDQADAQVSVRPDGQLRVLAVLPSADAGPGAPSPLQLLFNTDLAPDTVARAQVTLRRLDGAGDRLDTTLRYDEDARLLTAVPASPLAPGASYEATLSGPLMSRHGHALTTPFVWRVTRPEP